VFAAPTDSKGRARLLPPSLPARWFAAAAAFHLLGWLIVALEPHRVMLHGGGLGPGLAALHAFTLGTLAMAAIGVSQQLLPVATVQPVRRLGASRAAWWLLVPSVAALVAGFAVGAGALAAAGGVGAAAGLAIHGLLTAGQLAAAKRQRALTAAGWGGLVALVAVLATGPALAWRLHAGVPALAPGVVPLHAIAGVAGFLGLPAIGFSGLLVPMFMVAKGPGESRQRRVLAAFAAAIVAAGALALADAPTGWSVAAGACALAAALAHGHAMLVAIRRRRNREAGWLAPLLAIAWGALPAGIGAWLACLATARPWLAAVAVILLVGGWLLGLVLAMLLRIAPFLASVHVKIACGALPGLTALTPRGPARLLALAHPAAIASLLAGVSWGDVRWVQAGGVFGVAAALGLVGFLAGVSRRARRLADRRAN